MDTERSGMNAIGPSPRMEGQSGAARTPGRAARTLCRLLPGVRRAMRLIGWNTVWLITGLALIAAAGEIRFRLTVPFARNVHPSQYVPGVGRIRKPLAEFRHTNNVDFWTVSRTNSLGFLDREPIGPERAAASCHIAMIGDSFVEGREVSIPDKFHVRLEALAARARPELNVTTSAFGMSDTGQIAQLPYYDEFARHLRPKLVVLVFVENDLYENAREGMYPFVTAKKDETGTLTLRPPTATASPGFEGRTRTQLPFVKSLFKSARSIPFLKRAAERLTKVIKMSYFAQWLDTKLDSMVVSRLRARPAATSFALDKFKERTDRDGASLAILTSHTIGRRGERMFDRFRAMADERGIPVIDQYDYIIRKGGRIEDAHWTHDDHWNAAGHRWAAEALFEYLEQHPETCGGTMAGGTTHGGTS